MCNFLQEVVSDQNLISQPESSKYHVKLFGSNILISICASRLKAVFRMKTYFPAEYPTSKPDTDHLY